MIKLFFSPAGRSTRRQFWIGVIGFLIVCVFCFNVLGAVVETIAYFWLFMIFVVLLFQMLYSVFGKRLHDMGLSYWPLTGMIVLIFLILIAVMLANGGSEYFSEFSQYHRKEDIDPEVSRQIIETYQAKMEPAKNIAKFLILLSWAAFTLWLGLAKPDPNENKYGKPLVDS